MKRLVLLFLFGGVAALPGFAGSCSLTNAACYSGLQNSRVPVPVSVNFGPSSGLDTLSLTGISFENASGKVINSNVSGGTFSLTSTAGSKNVSATFSNLGFSSNSGPVTVTLTFGYDGTELLSPNVTADVTQGTLKGGVKVTGGLTPTTVTESVTIEPNTKLFTLTNLFEITPNTHDPVESKTGGRWFNAQGDVVAAPVFDPTSAPEPLSLMLVGLSLVGGAALTMRRRRQRSEKKVDE